MSLFKTITNGMANAGTLIQENFEKLAKAIVSIDDTTGEIELGDVKVNNLVVNGAPNSDVVKTTITASGIEWNFTRFRNGMVVLNSNTDANTVQFTAPGWIIRRNEFPNGYKPISNGITFTPSVFIYGAANQNNWWQIGDGLYAQSVTNSTSSSRKIISAVYYTTDPWPD